MSIEQAKKPKKGPAKGISQSIVKYCEVCERETKHFNKSGNCRTCAQLSAYTLQECLIHGVGKFRSGVCCSCKNTLTTKLKECPTHGMTKFQGNTCCKCALGAHRFAKEWCEDCSEETTHQMGTCMACNRGGFVVGHYAKAKLCVWSSFDGCEGEFTLNSGAQELCKAGHYTDCFLCGDPYAIESSHGQRFRDYAEQREQQLCEPCRNSMIKARLSESARNRSFSFNTLPGDELGLRLCEFSELPLTQASACTTVYKVTNHRQRQCLGDHYVLCVCGDEMKLSLSRIEEFLSTGKLCLSCISYKKTVTQVCGVCQKETKHGAVNGECLTCSQRKSYARKNCSVCLRDTVHKSNTCLNCVIAKSHSKTETWCQDCSRETTHINSKCTSCRAKALVATNYCNTCMSETTFFGNTCLPCRNRRYFSFSYCEVCDRSTTFMGKGCMTCSSVKAGATRLANFKASAKLTGHFQSKVELSYLEALSLESGYIKNKQVDGIDHERKIAFEYDGWFWHGKEESLARDYHYTKLLLELGYRVARIREHSGKRGPLTPVPIEHENLKQWSTDFGTMDEIVDSIKEFFHGH